MRTRWGRALPVAAVVVAAGCSGGTTTHVGVSSDCAWRLSYGGRVYGLPVESGPIVPGLRHEGPVLGQGSFPGCDDGGGDEPDQPVTVYRIRGVDPALAVITRDDQIGVTGGRLPASVRALLGPSGAPAS